jgi:hypothetical protein
MRRLVLFLAISITKCQERSVVLQSTSRSCSWKRSRPCRSRKSCSHCQKMSVEGCFFVMHAGHQGVPRSLGGINPPQQS